MIHQFGPDLKIAAALVFSLFFSGCQSVNSNGLTISEAPVEISAAVASEIASDMVGALAEELGPGTTTIALQLDGSQFGAALEASLKGWGYAVVTDQPTDQMASLVTLAYVVVSFENQLLARFSTTGIELGRAYTTTETGAAPSSPVSRMRRG